MVRSELARLNAPPKDAVELVDVPAMRFLTVEGTGDPNTSPEYREAVEALYSVAYALRFGLKRDSVDVKVGPLEGLWSGDPGALGPEGRAGWRWTVMISQPEAVTAAMVEAAVASAGRKKRLPALGRMRFETLHEGLCAQVMHLGPYSEESHTIERLHRFMAERGYVHAGRHHEIYLGDHRRTAHERLRTVLRQPVRER